MIQEIDLPEATRRNDTFEELNELVDRLTNLSVFPSLMWLWAFDIIRDIYKNNAEYGYDESIAEGVTLKQIFDKFWDDCDGLGLNMDMGGEIIEETIRDWMRENDFIVALDDDAWLDEEEDEDE